MDPRNRASTTEQKKKTKDLLDRAFDRLVGSQLSAHEASKRKNLTEEDEEQYRQQLAVQRERAHKKKRKVMSKEQEELARNTGLSGQVVALMTKDGASTPTSTGSSDDNRKSKSKKERKSRKKSDRKHKRDRMRKRRKETSKRSSSSRHRRSRSYSSDSYSSYSYSDDYSDSSSSSDKGDGRRRRKHRKSRKDSKKRKHKKDRDPKRDKKGEKAKKRRYRDDDSGGSEEKNKRDSGAGNLSSQFGRYGIIRESDFTGNSQKVRRSFDIWLQEIKGVSSFTGPKWELLQYFKDFMEDFNTATLPHEKYYDYDAWEMQDYAKKKREAEDAALTGGSKARSDEFKHREEMKQKQEEKQRAELELMRATVGAKREEMRHQALLKAELERAYKMGDQEKIKQLKRRLEPEERK